MAGRKKLDIKIGQKFNKLTVVSEEHPLQENKRNVRTFLVMCDCGRTKSVRLASLTSNKTKTCGHCVYEKHKMSDTDTYSIWSGIIQRCTNPNATKYLLYGGNGVTVCDRWLKFENFLEDMGERPEGLSINRINGSKVYSKETCEWTTYSVQSYDQKMRSDNTSGVIGVYWNKRQNVWSARIDKDGKSIWLGNFKTLDDAKIARRNAELKYFGFYREQ